MALLLSAYGKKGRMMKMKKRIFALLPLFCLLLGACAAPTEHVSESTVAPALSEIGAPALLDEGCAL